LRNCGVGAETAGMTVHGGHRHGAKTAATGGGVTTWRGECGGLWAGGARRSQTAATGGEGDHHAPKRGQIKNHVEMYRYRGLGRVGA